MRSAIWCFQVLKPGTSIEFRSIQIREFELSKAVANQIAHAWSRAEGFRGRLFARFQARAHRRERLLTARLGVSPLGMELE